MNIGSVLMVLPISDDSKRQLRERIRQVRGVVARVEVAGWRALSRLHREWRSRDAGTLDELVRELGAIEELLGDGERLELARPTRDLRANTGDLRQRAFGLGVSALRAGRPEQAVAVAEALLEAFFRDELGFVLRARSRAALGDLDGSAADLRVANARPQSWSDCRVQAERERAWYLLGLRFDDLCLHDPREPMEDRLRALQGQLADLLRTDWLETQDAREVGEQWSTVSLQGRGSPVLNPSPRTRAAMTTAMNYFQAGRYEDASDALRNVLGEPGGLSPEALMALARAERAQSSYRRARNLLVFARVGRRKRAEALTQEAELAWIEHDYGSGQLLATEALALQSGTKAAELLRDRCERPLTVLPEVRAGRLLTHAAFLVERGGNFGDMVLPVAVRRAIECHGGTFDWLPVHVHQRFDEERLALANRSAGIVVGGGGLFLPDTSPNGDSGWQWNISTPMFQRLKVPLGVVAVGYNLFPGQEFRGPLFRQSLEAMVNRAAVVGLRNRGSVNKVKEILPSHLADKVSFLPCPTTVLRHLGGGEAPVREPRAPGPVLINTAFDRSARRFGDTYPRFLGEMQRAISCFRAWGVEVRFASHMPSDERFVRDLEEVSSIRLEVDRLYAMEIDDACDVYRHAGVVVGMRGHAGMIPFGLGTPILSLISHPKLRYFLEDIGRTSWGLDVHAEDLGDVLVEKVRYVLDNQAAVRREIDELQQNLLRVIQTEVERFLGVL